MAEPKTQKNDASVEDFIRSVDNPKKVEDSFQILELMKEVTGKEPSMWGTSIIGFGTYRYKYASGREGDWPQVGFSPRKQRFSLYIMAGFERYGELLEKLGKHKTGKSCLYINKLADVDLDVLRELIALSIEHIQELYPETS